MLDAIYYFLQNGQEISLALGFLPFEEPRAVN